MSLQITQLLTYAGPPMLGALIGYLTNKVAIRMLFRPLKAWYVFGIRVPMTPGIIPSKRHDLAINFGEMVGEQLLTATDIGAALSAEPFQDHLHQLVDDRVKDLLKRDLGAFVTVVPRRFRAYARVGIRTLKYQMREGVDSYIDSQSFADKVGDAVLEQLQVLGSSELNALVQADNRQGVYSFIDGLVEDLLTGEQVVDWLADYLQKYFNNAAVAGKTVADLLPEELQDLICSTIEEQAPQLLEQVAKMVSEPDVRDQLIQAIKGGVDNFLDTLGPMAAMARGFIDMDSRDEKIRTYLEDKEEELAKWLQNPAVRERVAQALLEHTRKFLDTRLADLLVKVDPDRLEGIYQQVAIQLMAVLRSGGVQSTLSTMIKEQLEEMLDQGHITMADLTELLLPGEQGLGVRQTVISELLAMLRSEQVSRLVGKMVNSMVDQVASRPLGILHELMPVGVRNGITDYIVLTANRMLLKEVPGLVHSLNIKEMVTEKVDSLDLLRLERLLLSIMEEQFKYINLFGALLGFLIGLINLVVLRLH